MLTKFHTNPSKFFLGRPKKKLEGFVWSFLSITGLRSQRQYPDKSHNLRNFIFMTSSLQYSIGESRNSNPQRGWGTGVEGSQIKASGSGDENGGRSPPSPVPFDSPHFLLSFRVWRFREQKHWRTRKTKRLPALQAT